MTWGNFFALFGAMFFLALLPSPSVFAVIASALSSGLLGGIAMAAGIVSGDFLFIVAAISGMAAIAETVTGLFAVLNVVGGLYLLWMAMQLWRSRSQSTIDELKTKPSSLLANYASGLLITLGDYKAMLFYVSFFPAFVDISTLSMSDAFVVLGTAAIAVGGVKMGYAYLADRARAVLKQPNIRLMMNSVAAVILFATGGFVLLKPLI